MKSQIQSQLGNPNQNMQPAQPVQPQQVNLWDELANQNALIMIFRPFIDKAADKSISKVDKFLKMIQEEDGTVDIEPLLGKMTDNLIVAATKEYPDLFGGVTIGNGKIKIGVPGIDKDIVLEAADIDHFKNCLK